MRTATFLALVGITLAARADDRKLAAVLGDPPDRWGIAWRDGGKNDYTLSDFEGQSLLTAGPNSTILTRKVPITGDAEVTVRFRLALGEKREIWFWLAAGLQKPEEDGENLTKLGLRIFPGLDQETMHWSMHALPGQKHGPSGVYTIRGLPPDRKVWPDFVRARAEADFNSTAPLGQRWLTVRFVLRKNACLTYLDGRLLREARHEKLVTTGHLKFTLFNGVQLGSIRVRPLPPEDSRFEKVQLDDYLNTSRFQGSTLDRSALPAGKVTTVGKVPFLAPTPDAAKNDHIDLKPSWLRVGLLEGGFDPWEGELSRWGGALVRDKGRICFRVRNARYRALHLLAAAADEPDTFPLVTAQFYRPAGGFPVNFATRVPLFSATAKGEALPVKLADGKQGRLFLVTIPLEPEGLDSFADLDNLEFELTKTVQVHRSYPDPIYYSQHQAGLPSGVHVYGVTLEQPELEVEVQPVHFAHIWIAPEKPSYTATLTNRTAQPQKVGLRFALTNEWSSRSEEETVTVPAMGELKHRFMGTPNRHGHHRVRLDITDSGGKWTLSRALAYLHRDTRERGGWEEGKGPIFGFWDWAGGHHTPGGLPRLKVMGDAGCESVNHSFHSPGHAGDLYSDTEKAYAEKHGMKSFFLAYQLTMGKHSLGIDWDPKKPAAMEKSLIATMKKSPLLTRSKINKPELAVFFGEPVLGPISWMSLPEYYGEPPYKMTAEEQKAYQDIHDQFVTAARAIKREWPDAKCLMPWGLPLFPTPFLRHSKEARDLMDGPALDVVLFERLPEMQLHQVTLSSQLWQLKQEWLRAGKKWPNLMSIEGPCVGPAAPGSLTPQQEADHTIRALLVLSAYGTTRHLGWPTPFACGSAWGESHYGSGMCERIPLLSPKPVYSAYATLTRQLNRMNFVKVVPTGSHTVFCLQFKHYKSGELLHVFWTLRGKRPVTVDAAGGVKVEDWMDNPAALERNEKQSRFTATSSPCYVRGLPDGVKITLGEPDHSDAKPGALARQIGDLGDGTWKLSTERDEDYEGSHPEFVRRFPGKMSLKVVEKSLAVRLEKQEKERRTMPFYTTLVPAKPIAITGKASHLGLWVKASSDWGRVVYCLRDAKGERWLSVGKKGEWNVDDVHCWSAFNFDGRRYLTFELPGNAPYDGYREAGTSFWGPYGKGDTIVDLPLTLEKVIVERRTHVIAPTEQFPASTDDVLLGGLFAEYGAEGDRTEEAVRLSRLRMPPR